MKRETKQAKLAALLGIELPKKKTKEDLIAEGTVSREAEAVILFGLHPKQFIQKECAQCGLVFAVNRTSIAVCSDECRKHYILNRYKLEWDPTARSLEERWSSQTGGPEPLVVPPYVLPMIQDGPLPEPGTEKETVEKSLDELLDLSEFGVG